MLFTDTSRFQGDGGSRVSGGEQAGPVSRPAGAGGRGPLPGSGEPLSIPGGFGGRELPGHRQPLHPSHPAGDGAPQVQSRQAALQRLQVHGQAHQQCVREEEEVGVTPQGLGGRGRSPIKGKWSHDRAESCTRTNTDDVCGSTTFTVYKKLEKYDSKTS